MAPTKMELLSSMVWEVPEGFESLSLRNGSAVVLVPAGEMTERPKVYDWKSYVPRKGTEGSNPSLSVFRAIFVRI